MQHKINPTLLGERNDAAADAIQSCVHCGFCLAACPTYHVLGEEMDSPRGRIYLMKSVLEEQITAEEAQPYIDRCLGCMACMPACPSGVGYGDLLTSYRAMVEKDRQRPLLDTVARKMVTETLPYPKRFKAAVATGKIGKLVQPLLPAQFQGMLNMLPEKLPKTRPFPDIYPAKGEKRATVALLTGCVQQVLAPEINWATLNVLAENGVETIIPKHQGCCGSILMHVGEDEHAQKLAKQNLTAFDLDHIDAIITNAAGCGSGIHEYGLLFKGKTEEEAARTFADKTKDITTFLADLGLRPFPENQPPRRVVYQDACHLRHAQGITSPPRQLLQAIPNLTLIELNDDGLCCGSAGTYNLEQPEIAHQLGQLKAEGIQATKADSVVSGNIGCLTQIKTHLNLRGTELPIKHTIQLLADAYAM